MRLAALAAAKSAGYNVDSAPAQRIGRAVWKHRPGDVSHRTRMGASSHDSLNFDVLRIVAVGLVAGNGLVLTGGSPPGIWGAPLPRIGLDLLFAVAGYLAADSLARAASPARFILGRVRRVVPALAASTLLTAVAIGPLATTLPLRDYFLASSTRRYLLNILLLPHPFLPRMFDGQQWSGAANPMLWTLAAYAFGCAVLLLWRTDLIMLCFAVTWIMASWVGYWTIVVEWLALPYVAVAVGRMALPGLSALGRLGNPSYGAYLMEFPLQQAIVARWPGAAHPILLCLAGAAALGLLSWHLIERPALAPRAP